jgi:nonribosomal peptide synthetase DhbF
MTVMESGAGGTHEMAEVLPLSAAQRGVWFAQLVEPARGIYNMGEYLDIRGPVDIEMLERVVRVTAEEADNLRTHLRVDGDEVVQVVSARSELGLEVVDLTGAPDPLAAAEEWMRDQLWGERSMDTLYGAAAIHVGQEHTLFFFRGSHLINDAFGAALTGARTAQLYADLSKGGEPSPRWFGHVRDLVAADQAYGSSPDRAADREFWLEQIAARPRAETLSGHDVRIASRTRCFRRKYAKRDAAGIVELAEQLGVSTSTVLLAHMAVHRDGPADQDAAGPTSRTS